MALPRESPVCRTKFDKLVDGKVQTEKPQNKQLISSLHAGRHRVVVSAPLTAAHTSAQFAQKDKDTGLLPVCHFVHPLHVGGEDEFLTKAQSGALPKQQ